MDKPEISVCIPAYRAQNHLDASIRSVLAQTYHDWELVIVDNASTDRTGAIAHSFADPRIRVVTNDSTIPLVDNWRKVVNHSRGRYVKLLPADDLLHPECLEHQIKDFESNPTAALVACRRNFIDRSGQVVLPARGLVGLLGHRTADEVIDALVRSGVNLIGEPAAYLFRRDDFVAIGSFDQALPFAVDLALVTRLLERGTFYGQEQVLASFRLRSDSYTAAGIRTQAAQHRVLLRQLAARPRWSISRWALMRGIARTHIAGLQRQLLYTAVSSRIGLLHRLPALLLRRPPEGGERPELP